MSSIPHSIRDYSKKRLPPRFVKAIRFARSRYFDLRYRLHLYQDLTSRNRPHARAKFVAQVIRAAISPRMTVLFFPERPHKRSVVLKLCVILDYAIAIDPDLHWDVAFKYHDTTFSDRRALDRLPQERRIINRDSVDISKTAIDRTLHQVFGYSAAVDPLKHVGPAVQKSDLNAMHDGLVVDCPLSPGALVPGCVYRKLIDNTVSSDVVSSLRVPVHGHRIPLVYVKYRTIERRFKEKPDRVDIAEPHEVFSSVELEKILAFARAIGLDFGEMDVLRDKADGRIYIVDANNTPYGPPARVLPAALKPVVYSRLAHTFALLIQEAAVGPGRSSVIPSDGRR